MSSLRNWDIVKFTTLIPALGFLYLFLNETGFYWPQKEALMLSLISGIFCNWHDVLSYFHKEIWTG